MRVLSYNIHKGIGGRDRRYDLQRVIAVIAAQKPDVVCLQEVDSNVRRSGYDHQPGVLAERLGMEWSAYQLNHRVQDGGYGNLLLSRFPIERCDDVDLKKAWRKSRAAQVARLETPEGTVTIVNQHLGLAERERRWQIRQLLTSAPMQKSASVPAVIIGDFNDWRNVLHRFELERSGFSQVTEPITRFRTFPAYMPAGALDKAFVRRLQVLGSAVVADRVAREASDHLPIVVDVAV